MKKIKLLAIFLLLTILHLPIADIYASGRKSGEIYEITDDIIDSGGSQNTFGIRDYQGSFSCFVSSFVITSTDITGGYLPNINNIPTVTALTEPPDDVWLTYSTPTFKWNYFDYDGHPQSGYQLQLSLFSDFSYIYYDTDNFSSDVSSHVASGIASGRYFWRVRVRDNYWNEWSAWSSTRALNVEIDAPCGQQITSLTVHTTSITYTWSASTYTTVSGMHSLPYWMEWSKDNFQTIAGNSGWLSGSSSITFSGIIPNTKYQFRIKARNLVGHTGPWSPVVTSSYTYIQTPTDISFDRIGTTSMTLSGLTESGSGSAAFTNLTLNNSGILFNELVTGLNSGWLTNNTYSYTGLTPNTTYGFTLKARNAEVPLPVETPLLGPIVKATRIEPVVSCSWEVGSSSIGIRASGTFTNLDKGQSGLNYRISISTWQWTNASVSSSVWVQSGETYYFTVYNGAGDSLEPNTTYYFISNSRNFDGLVNSTSTVFAKMTLPTTPIAPTVSYPSSSPLNRLVVRILNENPNNPDHTQYAIGISTMPSGSPIYWVQSNCSTGTVVVWQTKSSWNRDLWEDSSGGVRGLLWNTTYYFMVVARNSENAETALSTANARCTHAQMPYNIALSTSSGELGRLDALWAVGAADSYQVQITSHATGDFDLYISSTSEWTSLSSWTFTNLLINTKYYIRVRSRNSSGHPTPWVTEGDKYNYTISAPPQNVNIKYDIGYSSLTVVWSNGQNPAGTATKYIVQISSSESFNWITADQGSPNGATFESALEHKFTGLVKNTKYWARVRSVSGDGAVGRYYSSWQTAGSSCTYIDTPTSINVSNITQTNATLTILWEGQFDLSDTGGDGASWYLYKENDSNAYPSITTPGQDTDWRDGVTGTVQDIFGTTHGTLVANTTSQFLVKVRNKDKVETPWVASNIICTRIQAPTGVTLVESTTWYVRAKPAGTFTNLGQGTTVSAIVVWRDGESEPDDLEQVGAKWKSSIDDYRQFVGGPDSQVILYTKSRNKYGHQSYYGTPQNPTPTTYYTLAETPPPPSLTGATTSSITIKVNPAGNPSVTVYAVKITTSGGLDRWLTASGTLDTAPVWQTRANWGGDDGKVLTGLTANTSYFASVAARNRAGTMTPYSAVATAWTAIEAVSVISVLEIASDSIKVQSIPSSSPQFTNLGSGASHIRVSTDTSNFPDSGYQVLKATTVFTFDNLPPNTEHTIYARAYNGEDVGAGGPSGVSISTATRIQSATGVEFGTVSNSVITARAAGTFNNLSDAQSGVIVYKVSPVPVDDSGWQQNTNFWTFSGLQPNTTYYFKANSRNRRGLVNTETILISTVTRANAPSAPSVSIVSTDTLKVVINENNNPPATEFRILASSTNWATTKYVQANGTLGDTVIWRSKESWGGDLGINVIGLNPNTQYKFKATARNSVGIQTSDSAEGARYTKIQSPAGMSYEIYQTSVVVTALGEMSNVEQLGWIQFGVTAGQGWTDTPDINGTGAQSYIWTSLLPNTTYNFRVRTKNAMLDAINDYLVDEATATRIQMVSNCHIQVDSSGQLSAIPSNVASMSNLTVGQSGWRVRIRDDVTGEITNSEWRNDTVMISSSGLKPNRLYHFSGRSRNRFGLENGWSQETSTYTYASAPSSPVVQAVAGYDDRLKVVIDNFATNGNPDITTYRVEIRRTDDGDWSTNTKYIKEEGGVFIVSDYVSSATYKTRAQWGGGSGFVVVGLASNKEYAIRLRARNAYGHLSSGGEQTIRKTLPGKPANLVAVPTSGFETSRISLTWDSNGYQYMVQHSTSFWGVWSDLFTPWNLTASSTIHYNLTPSSCVFYRVKARNTELAETDWSDVVSTYTWAAVPSVAYLLQPTTYSMVVEWALSGNPSNVQWLAEVSVDSTSFSGAVSSGWISSTYTIISELNTNHKYWARVKARNPVNIQTVWSNVSGYRYTLIPDCTDVVMVDFGTNWIKMKAVPEPVNLGSSYDSTGIEFKNSDLENGTSSQWIQTNLWTDSTNLGINTPYNYRVRVRNGDGVVGTGGWQPSSWRTLATAMQSPTAVVVLSVSSHNVLARVNPDSGYSNIASGASGLVIECHGNDEYSAFISSTGWSKTENLTGNFTGLNANTTYYFRARSRNRLGYEAAWSGFGSTVTLCATPSSNTPLYITSNSFTARWGDGGNPWGTRYEVWWSTSANYSTYLSSITTQNELDLVSLISNATYYTQVRALNRAGTPTAWVALPQVLTEIEPPQGIDFVDVSTGSIRAKVLGSFTSIGEGSSGWLIENLIAVTSSYWQSGEPTYWNSASDPDSGSPDSLKASRQYKFRARTRNRMGNITPYIEVSTWTKARVPGYEHLSQISTWTIRANWTSNENVNAQYYIECSTHSNFSVIHATADWSGSLSYLFNNLQPNTRYYFRAKARNTNLAGTDTAWTILPSSYTWIEQVVSCQWPLVGVTSMTIVPSQVSNIGEGLSGIVFKWSLDENFLSNVSSTSFIKQLSTTVANLLPNTTYYFRFIARNGDGTPRDETSSWAKSTLANIPGQPTITNPTGTTFTIWISSNFNSAHTLYAIKAILGPTTYYVTSDKTLSTDPLAESWDTLQGRGNPFVLSNLAGNTQYTISVRARNSDGVMTSYSQSVTSSTLADVPGQPSLSSISTHSINVVLNEGSNSAQTEFAIAVSSDNWATTMFVSSSSYETITSAEWATKSGWGGVIGRQIATRRPNTKFAFKTIARNKDGILTDWSLTSEKFTRIESPEGINFKTYSSSIGVSVSGQFTYEPGEQWVRFRRDSSFASWSETNQHYWTSLLPNTTYNFYTQTRNKENLENSWVGPIENSTLIELPTGLEYRVYVSSIEVRPTGNFTNLSVGPSGIIVVSQNDSSQLWQNTTNYWWTFTGLEVASAYNFRANSRNRYGIANSSTAWQQLFTRPATPPAPQITNASASFIGLKVLEGENSGNTNVKYAIALSTSSGFESLQYATYTGTNYTLSSNPSWLSYDDWGGVLGFNLGGLNSNTTYYVATKARNPDGLETPYSFISSTRTKITTPTALEFIMLGESSASVKGVNPEIAAFEPADSSGINFEVFVDSYVNFHSSSSFIKTNFWTAQGLVANTTYWWRITTKNPDGTLNSSNKVGAMAQRIESVGSIIFQVTSPNAIQVAPLPPDYTEIDKGVSGIIFYETTISTNSGWRKTTDYWTLSGLLPNTAYTFRARSRNRSGLENPLTISYTTYTHANIPLAPAVSPLTTATINVVVNENSNPAATLFAIAVSTDNWATTQFVQSGGNIANSAVWLTRTDWGGASGMNVINLEANRQYRFRVKARNQAGIETSYSNVSTKYTLIERSTSAVFSNITANQITLSGEPAPTRLTSGNSGILFENATLGTNSGWKTTNSWTETGLSTNTIYNYIITTKNGDGVANEPSGLISRATRIEQPSQLTCDQITTNSLRLLTQSQSGVFSNLSSGQSGIYFYGVNISTDSGWLKQSSWTVGGLAPSTRYIFNVKSRNADAQIESSPLAENVTFYTAPSEVNITSLDTGSPADRAIFIKISSGTNGHETLYQVAVSTTNFTSGTTYYVDATLGTLSVVSDTTTATWGTHPVWRTDTGDGKNITELKGNTLYSFKVRAKNPQNLISNWSAVQQRTTNASAPENLTATALSSSSINITWSGTGPKYQVERATWNAPINALPETNGWTRVMHWDVSTSTNDVGLLPNRRYFYRVRAGDTGDVGVSNWAGGNFYKYTLASPPELISYSQVKSDKITIDYRNDINPSGTEYRIQISTSSDFAGASAGDSGWTEVLSSTFSALSPNIIYYVRARARNFELTASSWVNFGSTSTLAVTPEAPNVSTSSTVSLIVKLADDINSPQTQYGIKSVVGSSTFYVLSDGNLGTSPVWRTKQEWGNEIAVVNLSTNTRYHFSVSARNANGIATEFGPSRAKFTLSAPPAFSNYVVHMSSIGVVWTSNENPSGTQYRVERATSSSFTGSVISNDEGWASISSTTFTDLDPNRRYHFRIISRNGDNITSAYAIPAAVYTKIESAQGLNFEIYWTSFSVTPQGTFSNLAEGQSKLEFKEYVTGQSFIQTTTNTWFMGGNLTPNTTYGFTIRSYNGDGLANPESAITIKATRIENPTGLNFIEAATYYIKVQPKNEFSNLSAGFSGVKIERCNSNGIGLGETSGYQNSTSAWTNSGLDPSRIYHYRLRTKNRDGLENNWVILFSTYTHAQPPQPGSPSIVSAGIDYLEVNWYEANNSTYTYYIVEGSSVSYGGIPTNSSPWLLNTTFYFLNLIPNTSYYIRVKAKNLANVETNWTQLGSAWTKIQPVTGITFSNIFQTSVTVNASGGPFARLDSALSGIYFDVYRDEFYSTRHSSIPYTSSSSWTVTGLAPNTTYYFRSNSRSGSGETNNPVGDQDNPISAITLIEKVQGIKFGTITNTSIQAAPDGIFTNLNSSGSGVITYSLTTSSSSGWRNTTSYFNISQLSPNTLYSFKANSRNRAGVESGETAVISTYTLASNPLASVFTNISTHTIRASWTAGLPTNPENTEYYVEASSVSPSGPYNYKDGWQTNIYRDFENLSPNTKYYFRVKSRNFAGAESPWVDLGSKYTLIETVESANYNIYYTSITVTATPQPSNLDEGNSGIIFTNQTTGFNSGWITNINYIFTGLNQNTTYQFRVNTKNGEGISNTPYNLPLICTLINPATGVAFNTLTTTSIEARALGDFPPNLGAGNSAIAIQTQNTDIDYTSFTWISSNNWRTFVGLSTNTAYQFRANTRNQLGITASSSPWVTRYTMAATPGSVIVTTNTPTSLKIISVGKNTNPDNTEFAVAISSSLSFDTTAYVQPDGQVGQTVYWASWTSGWANNLTVVGLLPNTTYYFKAIARNGDSPPAVTSFGPVSSRITRSQIPQITSIVPSPSAGNTELVVSWSGIAWQYKVWTATYSAPEVSRTLLVDWVSSTWTVHSSLSPNRRYYYWLKSRNSDLIESDWSDETSGWTNASLPGQVNPYYSRVSQDSMQINWTHGSPPNPSGTIYKIERSTNPEFTGNVSALNITTTFYYYDGTLSPNRRYYYRISARNNATEPVWTSPVELNLPTFGRATLIESPTGITVENIATNSLRITAVGEFFNLTNPDPGNNSAINFKYTADGGINEISRGYSQQNFWDISGLTPNTTYTFSAVSKNWDNVANNWIPYTSTTATRIESPWQLEFIVTTNTIHARPVFGSGPTNISREQSGIKLVRGTSILPDDDIEFIQSSSTWRTWSDLNPNTNYTFQIRTRNRMGLLNDWVTGFSTWTHCVVPSTPTVQDNPQDHTPPYGIHFTRIIIEGDNPTGPGKTNFAVWSVNDGKWLQNDGSTHAIIYWSTSTVWYHYNLSANTLYNYRVKARNNSGVETALSPTGSATTGPGAVNWITCQEKTIILEGELYRLKWDWADVGGANYYELWTSTNGTIYEQVAGFTTELTTSYYADHYSDRANQKFFARARGKQAASSGYGGWSPSTWTYTQIQRAQYVELQVINSTSIAMRARSIVNGNPSGFSNIQEGISGISYWCSTSPAVSPTIFVSSISWIQTTAYCLLPAALLPNTTYYFKVQSRNALGEEMPISSIADSTATWATIPSTPTLVVATSDTLRVAIMPNDNPPHTLFALYMDNPINRYVDASGNPTSITPVWQTYSDWGGSSGITITGLEKSSEYKIKSRAKNVRNILTNWSGTLSAYTLGGQPIIENTSPGAPTPSWTNISVWKFRATNSDSYRWLWNKIPDSNVSDNSSAPWDGTSEITLNITSAGNWYFHVGGFSGAPPSKTGQTTYGPIKYDNTPPEMLSISCQKSASDPTSIASGEWTREDTPYFYWTEPYSGGSAESPIAGYSISFSKDENVSPDTSIDTTNTYHEINTPITEGGIWYFKVRARDMAGNWSNIKIFTYKFNSGTDRPKVVSINPQGKQINGEWVGVGISNSIIITFDRAMDKTTTENAIELYVIRDKNGNTIFANVSGVATYNPQTYQVIFTPSAPLMKNYTYKIVVTAQAKDSMGNNLADARELTFKTVLDTEISNTIIASDEKTKVELDAGAIPSASNCYVVVNLNPLSAPIATDPAAITQATTKLAASGDKFSKVIPQTIREFVAYDGTGKQVKTFEADATITIPYPDADRDGVVDNTSPKIQAKSLKIVYLNESIKEWEELESAVDTTKRTVSARTRHFSIYAIKGAANKDVSAAYAYPIPFDSSKGDTTITFGKKPQAALPSNCKIRIYTISGALVATLEPDAGAPEFVWNLKNSEDQPVASGVYIYVIDNTEGSKKTGKLMIIK